MIVAAVQMVSDSLIERNLAEAEGLIAEASAAGARLVLLPENFALMAMHESEVVRLGEADGSGPVQEFLSRQAAAHRIWLIGGSVPLLGCDPNRVRSACLVYDAAGKRVARYDKMHLFDASVEDERGEYRESDSFEPGSEPVVCESPCGSVGLSICYDLRFPELYRRLADRGAEIFVVPAAFTAVTGAAHWEVLLRARAIENLCYVLAAAQGGRHANGRETHGDSMLVDPWGRVQERLARGSGIVLGRVDRRYLAERRQRLPCLRHRRIAAATPVQARLVRRPPTPVPTLPERES